MLRVSLTTTGNWGKLPFLPLLAFRMVKEDGFAETKKQAEKYIERVKEHIEEQDLNLEPLAPRTVARKKEHKYDRWIEKGEFKDKLSVVPVKGASNKIRFYAGASDEVMHLRSGLTMFTLAKYLEYGTKNELGPIPARPLFGLTSKEFEENFAKSLNVKIFRRIERYWSRI